MRGLMQDRPLLISSLIRHAAEYHTHAGVCSIDSDGALQRWTYPELHARAAQLAHALVRLGVKPGDRIATLAWNDNRHFETYFAVSGIGAVCHTINPRLFSEQISYIVRHAEDRWLFVDAGLLAAVEGVIADISGTIEGIVVLGEVPADSGLAAHTKLVAYEKLIAPEPATFDWPEFDETTASSLCYTSGTTGNPKGVLYSHRSTVLHAWSIALPDVIGLRAIDVVLPIVPMFHVNAWGIPYAAAMTGASLAMPGSRLDGPSLHKLIGEAGVTYAAGVPTVWLALLQHLRETGGSLPEGLRGLVGGSALPQALVEAYDKEFGIRLEHGWGMTEMSPVGSYNSVKPENKDMSRTDYYVHANKQGRPPFGVDMKIINEAGEPVPHDGETSGELCVRGPWITSGYYNSDEGAEQFIDGGWFRTGDVATIDQSGYLHIVDRVKDLIKSGGEWISSIELENLALGVAGVREAAAIPAKHEKWGERPVLVIVKDPDGELDETGVREHLAAHLSSWMMPDAVVFVDALPHTATGKVLKRQLRDEYSDYLVGRG
ncbi:MAG: long-chain fatty acid--CoA ligase [Hyphomicrobiaceae bacterium]